MRVPLAVAVRRSLLVAARARRAGAGVRRRRARPGERRLRGDPTATAACSSCRSSGPTSTSARVYLAYARQSPRERPQGYSTTAPARADRLARTAPRALVRPRGDPGQPRRPVRRRPPRASTGRAAGSRRAAPTAPKPRCAATAGTLLARDGAISSWRRRVSRVTSGASGQIRSGAAMAPHARPTTWRRSSTRTSTTSRSRRRCRRRRSSPSGSATGCS